MKKRKQQVGSTKHKQSVSAISRNLNKNIQQLEKLHRLAMEMDDSSSPTTSQNEPLNINNDTTGFETIGENIDAKIDEFLNNEHEECHHDAAQQHNSTEDVEIENEAELFSELSSIFLVQDEEVEEDTEDKEKQKKEFIEYWNRLGASNIAKSKIISKLASTKMHSSSEYSLLDFLVTFSRKIRSHNMSAKAIDDDLFYLTQFILKQDKQVFIPSTAYQFKQLIKSIIGSYTKGYYCKNCMEMRTMEVCLECNQVLKCNFLYKDLRELFADIVSRKSFLNNIDHTYATRIDNHYTDIFDGTNYKQNILPFTKEMNCFSYNMYFDGASPFKYSQNSVWSFLTYVNELNRDVRFRVENIHLMAVYFDSQKPDMQSIIRLFSAAIKEIESNGVMYEQTKYKFKLFLVLCDLPAHRLLFQITNHGGYYACSFCHIKGTYKEKVRYSCFEQTKLRTKETVEKAYQKLENTNFKKTVNGHTGIPKISKLGSMLELQTVDSLHQLFLGVSKDLLKHYFDSSNNHQPYYISEKARKIIDAEFANIKLPNHYHRNMMPLTKKCQSFKAEEVRIVMLYIISPLLKPHLPVQYWDHLNLLIQCMKIFLAKEATKEQIIEASYSLKLFIRLYEIYFDKCSMNLNEHILLHFGEVVLNNSFLWCYSTFPMESALGVIIRSNCGTKSIHHTLVFNFSLIHMCQNLEESGLLHKNLHIILQKLNSPNYPKVHQSWVTVQKGIYLIGKNISHDYLETIYAYQAFNRLMYNGLMYYSNTKSVKFNSYTVLYHINNEERIGEIQLFYLRVSQLNTTERSVWVKIKDLQHKEESIISLENLKEMVVAVTVYGETHCSKMVSPGNDTIL